MFTFNLAVQFLRYVLPFFFAWERMYWHFFIVASLHFSIASLMSLTFKF